MAANYHYFHQKRTLGVRVCGTDEHYSFQIALPMTVKSSKSEKLIASQQH